MVKVDPLMPSGKLPGGEQSVFLHKDVKFSAAGQQRQCAQVNRGQRGTRSRLRQRFVAPACLHGAGISRLRGIRPRPSALQHAPSARRAHDLALRLSAASAGSDA